MTGWIGSFLFSICAIPQALTSWRQGHSDGISWSFLLLWAGGEVFTTIYVWPLREWALLMNYACNFVSLVVIVAFKVFPVRSKTSADRRWQRFATIESRDVDQQGEGMGSESTRGPSSASVSTPA